MNILREYSREYSKYNHRPELTNHNRMTVSPSVRLRWHIPTRMLCSSLENCHYILFHHHDRNMRLLRLFSVMRNPQGSPQGPDRRQHPTLFYQEVLYRRYLLLDPEQDPQRHQPSLGIQQVPFRLQPPLGYQQDPYRQQLPLVRQQGPYRQQVPMTYKRYLQL